MKKMNIFMQMHQLKDLPASERHVIDYILKHPQKVCEMTIVELGANTFTSASTVSRLCQKLNTNGYPDFKQRICTDIDKYQEYVYLNTNRLPFSSSDSIEDTIDKVVANSTKALIDVKLLNSSDSFQKAIDWVTKASKVTIYGSGISNLIAQDAMNKGLRMGLNIYSFNHYAEMSMHARMSKKDDLGIIVSYTGFTLDMIKIAKILKLNNCKTISITSNSVNDISNNADLNLYVGISESYYRIGGIESRMSMQCVLDIVFSGYYNQTQKAKDASEKTFTEDTFSYNWQENIDSKTNE